MVRKLSGLSTFLLAIFSIYNGFIWMQPNRKSRSTILVSVLMPLQDPPECPSPPLSPCPVFRTLSKPSSSTLSFLIIIFNSIHLDGLCSHVSISIDHYVVLYFPKSFQICEGSVTPVRHQTLQGI